MSASSRPGRILPGWSFLQLALAAMIAFATPSFASEPPVPSTNPPRRGTTFPYAGLYFGPGRILDVGMSYIDFELNPDNARYFKSRGLMPERTRVRHWSTETSWARRRAGKRLLMLLRQDPDTASPAASSRPRPESVPVGEWVVFDEAGTSLLYASVAEGSGPNLEFPKERSLVKYDPLRYGIATGVPVSFVPVGELESEPVTCGYHVQLRTRFRADQAAIDLSPGESGTLPFADADFRVTVHEMSAHRFELTPGCHLHYKRPGAVHVTLVRIPTGHER
jgi:hypothetical protein